MKLVGKTRIQIENDKIVDTAQIEAERLIAEEIRNLAISSLGDKLKKV